MRKTTKFLHHLKWAWREDRNQFKNRALEMLSGLLVVISGVCVLLCAAGLFVCEPLLLLTRPLYYAAFRAADLERTMRLLGHTES